jgi:hypothetical protein
VRTSHTLSPHLDSYASYFAAIRLMDGPETLMERFPQPPALQFLKSLDDLDEEENDDDDDEVEDLDEEEEDEDDEDEDEDDEDEEDDEDGGVKPLKMAKATYSVPRADLV